MNIVQLEHFVEVVRCSSFTKAATKRFTSPQALSKAVADLEKELGARLIEKSGRGITPTPTGLKFAQAAEVVINDFLNLSASVQEYSEAETTSVYRIGITDSCYRGFVVDEPFFDDFVRDTFKQRINLMHSSSESCLKALRDGIIDGAFILGKIDNPLLDSREVAITWPGIVVGHNHPLASQSEISLRDLDKRLVANPIDLLYFRPRFIELCARESVHPRLDFVAPSIASYERFLYADGIFLTHRGSTLPLLANGTFIPLSKSDAFAVPYYYVARREHFDEKSSLILSFLRESFT